MIFASDLDHTLIYSERFLPQIKNTPLTQTESGVYNSYMTAKAAKILFDLNSRLTFIPCTTRTVEQYRRVKFDALEPEWAIVSNGGNILHNNVVDKSYQAEIRRKLQHECTNAQKILKQFAELNPSAWTEPLREADEVFFYCIFNKEKMPRQEFEDFSAWAKGQNWNISLQGRKLYLVPGSVDKGAALLRLSQILQKQITFAAGDSLLDISLLELAPNAFVPVHGEVRHYFSASGHWQYTKKDGLLAGEEIVANIAAIVTKQIYNL
ncbi:MAG: haloacid dehalogenase [Sporomusaceae bacterium]|jgi:hydroxymethylpyrimidine pyrophosphatase-like HAD family hydrolase|nr:haloacid dehalogenase [Sporomusaceae bacterium]